MIINRRDFQDLRKINSIKITKIIHIALIVFVKMTRSLHYVFYTRIKTKTEVNCCENSNRAKATRKEPGITISDVMSENYKYNEI